MRTPMPSPRGTNLERMFFTHVPLAMDEAPDASDPTAMFRMFLTRLSGDDKATLRAMLDDDDSPAMDSARKSVSHVRHDPDAGKSFRERFPNAKRFLG